MSQRDAKLLLWDMGDYTDRAIGLMGAASLEDFFVDTKLRLAVERCLQVISEAFTQAVKQDPDYIWKVNGSREMIAFRHVITHHYYRVSARLLWNYVSQDLRQLRKDLDAIEAGDPIRYDDL